jgi:hypothetical protein
MSRPFWFLDSRSLAFARILLGAVALYTFADLATDAAAFFGPNGTLPADIAWNGYSVKPWLFSLLFAFPQSMAPVVMMLALGIAGSLSLLLGFRGRISAFVAWWTFGSLAARNPLVLHAGDALFSILLLFSAFLPVDRHFRAGRKAAEPPILISNFSSTVWHAQVSVVYLAAGLVKVFTPSWYQGTHLTLLFKGTEIVTSFGRWLSHYPAVGWMGTITSLVFEFALGVLILCLPSSRQQLRLWLIAIAICFHLMIGLTLQVGLFPVLSLTALSTMLPPLFWDRLKRRHTEAAAQLPPVQATPFRRWQMGAAALVSAAVAWLGLGNAWPSLPQAPVFVAVGFHQLQWKNTWNVFADTPRVRRRLGLEAILRNGERIDLLEGKTLVPEKFNTLPSESDRFGGSRWRFLLIGNFANQSELRPLAVHYLRMVAAQHADNPALRGASWELVLYSAPIAQDGPLRITREVIAACTSPDQPAKP